MASKQFPHPFSAMAGRFRKFRKELPAVASGIALKEFRGNFRIQGYRASKGKITKWAPRQKKDEGRAILVKTGRLRRALRAAPTNNTARVVNATPYAAVHNRGEGIGGTARAWSTNLRSRKERLRSTAHGGKGGSKASMPARPFMVGTPGLMDDISAHILKGLETVFKAK